MELTLDIPGLADELTPHLAYRLLRTSGDTHNYDALAVLAASLDSANFAAEFFRSAARYPSDEALLRDAVRQAPLDGLVLEFGVASGRTLRFLAESYPGKVYGFDSFGGLPEDWRPGFGAGAFAQPPPETLPNAELVIGLFGDTLPGFLAAHPGPVKFAHIDCDLYSSTVTILEQLAPRITKGTVLVFDEFLNYPGWRLHEYKAWEEFRLRRGISFRYAGCVPSHQQVAVAIF
jgi:predicted O-methyltransferase YrrM